MFGVISFDNIINLPKVTEHTSLMNAEHHHYSPKQHPITQAENFLFYSADYYLNKDFLFLFKGKLNNLNSPLKDKHNDASKSCAKSIYEGFLAAGQAYIKKLTGEFVILIYNRITSEVVIYRDLIGLQPIYYVDDGKSLYFSTELRRLSSIKEFTEIDWDFLCLELASYAFPCSKEATWFSKIRRLPPGSALKFNTSFRSVEKYISFHDLINRKANKPAKVLAGTEKKLLNAISAAIQGYSSIATHLSGGLDSTIITVIAKELIQNKKQSIETYVCGLTEKQRANTYGVEDIIDFVNRICRECDLAIPEVTSYNENFHISDLNTSHQFPRTINLKNYLGDLCIKMNKSGQQVLLSGFGGDECLSFHYNPQLIKRAFVTGKWHSLWKDKAGYSMKYQLYFIYKAILGIWKQDRTASTKKQQILKSGISPSPLSRTATDVKTSMIDHLEAYHIAYRVEREIEFCSYYDIDICYPLLDRPLIEYMLNLSTKDVFYNKTSRGLMRAVSKKWIPYFDYLVQYKSQIATVPIEQLSLLKAIDLQLMDFKGVMKHLHPKLKSFINTEFSAPLVHDNKLDQRSMRVYLLLAEIDLFVKKYSE